MAGTGWELPVGPSVRKSWWSSSCSQGICAAQHRPEGHAILAARHSAGLGALGLTLLWVTDCLMCNGLLFGITTLTSTEKNGEVPKRARGFQT